MEDLIVNTQRVINELKSGRAVIISDENYSILVAATENISDNLYQMFKEHNGQLTLSKKRANFIKKESLTSLSISLNQINKTDLFAIIGEKDYHATSLPVTMEATFLQQKAIELLIQAELIPSCISTDKFSFNHNYLKIDISAIDNYDYDYSQNLKIVAKCPLNLKHALNSSIIAFTAEGSLKEHYAIIIGNPPIIPLIRIHSSCYTGDLISSLTCDCEDQLHSAIIKINNDGGGIILYLMQEGRNIGLINKLRAYDLKNRGLDTVDANLALGFDEDNRSFRAAAQMLKILGYSRVKILTNNPEKSNFLEQYGIKVEKCISHITSYNDYNRSYLKTKQTRLGHKLSFWKIIKNMLSF